MKLFKKNPVRHLFQQNVFTRKLKFVENLSCVFLIILFFSCLPASANASDLFLYFTPLTDFELCELIEEGVANDCDVSAEIREFYKNIPEDGPQIKMQKLDVFIRKKVQENPESIEWSGAYTNFCFFRGTPEKSYTCLNKACYELHTQVAQAWFFLASLEWKFRGNKDEAYKCVYRAIQLDPEDFSSLFLLGLANHFTIYP